MSQASTGKVPIVECVTTSWRFLFTHWRTFLPAALLTAPVGALSNWLSASLGGASALEQGFSELASILPVAAANIAFTAAVLRKAIRNEFSGFQGLQFGVDEFRLIGVAAGLMLLFLPLLILGAVGLGAFVLNRLGDTAAEAQRILGDPDKLYKALSDRLGPAGVMSLYLLILAAMALMLVVLARLFLLNAAAIGERRVVFFQTWKWMRGNVARVIAAIIITDLPAFLVMQMLSGLAYESVVAKGAIDATVYAAWGGILQVVAAMTGIPLIALGAHLYRGLRPADFQAK